MKRAVKNNGFSLIEIMSVVAIVGIISAIAIINYSSYVRSGRRVDAINTILSISLAEERYRSTHSTYGTLAQVWNGVTSSSEGYYSLSISNVSGTSYTITATAQNSQANDSSDGTSCSALALAMSNGVITKTPSACWPT